MYSKLVMSTPDTENRKIWRSRAMAFLEFFIYPEFRNYKLDKLFRIITKSVIVTTISITALSFFITDEQAVTVTRRAVGYKFDRLIFNDTIDHELLRASVYKESGVKIPEGVPYETLKLMYDRCEEKDIPLSIFFRLVYAESGFDSTVTSSAGATGYCGIMPETFSIWSKKLNLKGKTCKNNIIISTELLRVLNDKFKHFGKRKSWELTLASYNAGIGRVIAANYNIPEIRETQNYIRKILKEDL